jgi:hypothetical protein
MTKISKDETSFGPTAVQIRCGAEVLSDPENLSLTAARRGQVSTEGSRAEHLYRLEVPGNLKTGRPL